MKKVIIIIISIILLSSCEKQPFDYRNKFVGDYEFMTVIQEQDVNCCEGNAPCCTIESTVVYQGEITYGYESDEIIIDYIDDERDFYPNSDSWRIRKGKLHIKINKEGRGYGIFFNESGDVEFGVSFKGKTIQGTSHHVSGKKL